MAPEKCRLCLGKRNLTSIFEMKDSVMISTKVMSVAKVKIYPEDGLPSVICAKCIKILDICVNFIKRCEKSDVKLRAVSKRKLTLKPVKTEVNDDIQSETDSIGNESCENGIFDLQNDSRTLNEAVLCENVVNETDKFMLENDDDEIKVAGKKMIKQQCFTCGKVMSSRFRLKTHLRTHTGERPFTCPHCNKNFSLAQNLKVHLRIHTGEKPLSCNVCGDTFAHSAGLAVHRRKHTGQTPYKCTLCPRSFRTIGHLHYHIRRHTGEKNFECDTCGRAFITRSDLKQHLISHTGDKPHVCCVCGLRLTRASHLIRHMRSLHNEDEPYICPECPSKFSNKGYLDKHRKIHIVAKEEI